MSTENSELKLMTDDDIQSFIMDGIFSISPGVSVSTHQEIHESLVHSCETESPLGNNVLSRIPQMHQILRDPKVSGSLTSILGENYLLHPHRAVHRSTPVSEDTSNFDISTDKYLLGKNSTATSLWHQDAQSPTARARHHLPKYVIGFYFPHEVTSSMGPTRFKLGSYMQEDESAEDNLYQPAHINAGTFILCHFDMVHAGFPNFANFDRYLVKFVFTRTEYPVKPRWDMKDTSWKTASNAMTKNSYLNAWEHIWNWLLGDAAVSKNIHYSMQKTNTIKDQRIESIYHQSNPEQIVTLIKRLRSCEGENRHKRTLIQTEKEEYTLQDKKTDERRWNERAVVMEDESYALASIGEAALDDVLKLLDSHDPWIQINGIFIIGEIGYSSEKIVEILSKFLQSPHQEVIRQTLDALAVMPNQITSACLSAISALLKEKPANWLNAIVERGWTASDQIYLNASILLLNCSYKGKNKDNLESVLNNILQFSSGYSSIVASKALVNLGSSTAINTALTYFSDRAWDDTLIPSKKRY